MKRCTKCGIEKPLSDFWLRDGGRRRARCGECEAVYRRTYYRGYDAANKERRSAWNSENYHKHREAALARQARQPQERISARRILRNAVRSGRLIRPDWCGICGGTGRRIEAHHGDYARPLDVQWLCTDCHGLLRRTA